MKKSNLALLAGFFAVVISTPLAPPSNAQGDLSRPGTASRAQAAPVLYVYDFYASWCHNCTALKPTLGMIEKKYRGAVKVIAVDIDAAKNQRLVNRVGVSAVPTLVIVDNQGRSLKSFVGADQAKQLDPTIGMILNPTPGPATATLPARS